MFIEIRKALAVMAGAFSYVDRHWSASQRGVGGSIELRSVARVARTDSRPRSPTVRHSAGLRKVKVKIWYGD